MKAIGVFLICLCLCGCGNPYTNYMRFEKYFDSADGNKYPVLDLSNYKVIKIRIRHNSQYKAGHIDIFTVDTTDLAELFHYIKASNKLLNWAYKNIATCHMCGNSYPSSEMTELNQYGNISNFWVCNQCKKYAKENIKNNLKQINK